MWQAFRLIVYRDRLQAGHSTSRDLLANVLAVVIAVLVFIVLSGLLEQMAPARRMILLLCTLGVTFIADIFFTAITGLRAWFSSPESFYLITRPWQVEDMYRFHYLDAYLRFLKNFWHLLLPLLLAFGLVVQGWMGIWILLATFILLHGLAVHAGFLFMFFSCRGQRRFLRAGAATIAVLGIPAGLIGLGLTHPYPALAVFLTLALLVRWKTPEYTKAAFRDGQESAGVGYTIPINTPVTRFLQRFILYNRALDALFRAVLYRELATDARNAIFIAKYLAVAALLFIYWPLSQVEFVARADFTGALTFCFLIFVSSISESYITTFAKEGDRLILLLPRFSAWRVGMAKYTAAILEMLPLVLLAVLVVGARHDWSSLEAFTFAASLSLLIAAHLAGIQVAAVNLLSLENHDFSLLDGMVYEQVLGNVNPRILLTFLTTQVIPVSLVIVLWAIHEYHPTIGLVTSLWWLNLGLAIFITLLLGVGSKAFETRLASVLE